MKSSNSATKVTLIVLIGMWYFIIMLFVRIGLVVPIIISSALTAGFYWVTRCSGGDYAFRIWLTYAIGALVALVLSMKITNASAIMCIINGVVAPFVSCGLIHMIHKTKDFK